MSFLGTAFQVGSAITQLIVADHEQGNTNTLDALEKLGLDTEAVALAKTAALKELERRKTQRAFDEAARKDGTK